jgi:hypothetical protein
MLGFYDEEKLPTAWDNQATWNREHVWPKSWGNLGTSGPGADPHMLRPASVKTNSGRGNFIMAFQRWILLGSGPILPKYRGIAARIYFLYGHPLLEDKRFGFGRDATVQTHGKNPGF